MQQRRENLTAIDMWSVGCILSELFQMQKENVRNPQQRKPLFPGSSCFPLSRTETDPYTYANRCDQLNVIFDIIGTPRKDEISKLTDENAKKYLRSLPRKSPADLKRLYPGTSEEGLELLRGLLKFDVDKRMSVDQALERPFLRRVRHPDAEKRQNARTFQFEYIPIICLQQIKGGFVSLIFRNP